MNNNLDDIFGKDTKPEQQKTDGGQEKKPFDQNDWRQQKQIEREMAFTLIDDTAQEVSENPEQFQKFLDVQSKFDRYSVGNTLLIVAQNPSATKLADYDKWKEQGASIVKGEKGLVILEPGDEYKREDGTLAVSYNIKKVFDISQTTAEQKAPPQVITDNRLLIKALMNNAPVPINISDKLRNDIGALYSSDTKEILIRSGMESADIIRSLSQELAHAYMDKGGNYNRAECSFNAYAVSYIICKRIGIDTSAYDFSQLPEGFHELETQAIRNELSVIRKTANEISSNMSQVLYPPAKTQSHSKSEQSR